MPFLGWSALATRLRAQSRNGRYRKVGNPWSERDVSLLILADQLRPESLDRSWRCMDRRIPPTLCSVPPA